MAETIFERLIAGTTKDNSDSGAEVARKVNENFQKVSEEFTSLQKLVGSKSIAEQVSDILDEKNYVTSDDLSEMKDEINKSTEEAIGTATKNILAAVEHVAYEVTQKPDGVIIDYRDKEIRIFCPADTVWKHQSVGETGNANVYYLGFKAYAPDDSVTGFKEDMNETVLDETLHSFEGNKFAGIDEYGRKYSITWLGAAVYDSVSDTWAYYGAKSSAAKYVGWYYSVEWYNADGEMVSSDTIRINLTNESCHNTIEPYYMNDFLRNGDEIIINGGNATF